MYKKTDIDKPINQFFNAIFDFQMLEECDDITEQLKKRMVQLFEDVKEEKGKKQIKQIEYYPNGLCVWKGKYEKILLPAWESTSEIVVKKKTNYILLKRFNLIWYVQFMHYLKKPIRLEADKFNYREIKVLKEKYDQLSEEEKKIVERENGFDYAESLHDEYHKITNLFPKRIRGYNSKVEYDYYMGKLQTDIPRIGFLSEKQLEDLHLVYEQTNYKTSQQFESTLRELLILFAKKAEVENEEMNAIDLSDVLIPTDELKKQWKDENGGSFERSNYYKRPAYTFNFDTLEETFFAIVEKCKAVEDEKIQKVFKKINLF